VTCCQAQVRAGVANEASKADYEEFPLEIFQRRPDANEQTSMYSCVYSLISHLNRLTTSKRTAAAFCYVWSVTALAFWRPYANINLAALDHRESRSTSIFIMTVTPLTEYVEDRGTTTAEKLRGPGFGSQHRGARAPVLGVGGSRPLPLWRSRGFTLRKFLRNSNAKSCILVTICCEISCFLKTTAKKLGDQYIVGPPVSPGPYTVVAPMAEGLKRCPLVRLSVCRVPLEPDIVCWVADHVIVGTGVLFSIDGRRQWRADPILAAGGHFDRRGGVRRQPAKGTISGIKLCFVLCRCTNYQVELTKGSFQPP